MTPAAFRPCDDCPACHGAGFLEYYPDGRPDTCNVCNGHGVAKCSECDAPCELHRARVPYCLYCAAWEVAKAVDEHDDEGIARAAEALKARRAA